MLKIKDVLDNWKSILVSLTALLIVVPSVINGISDIWVAWRGLPIGSKEKVNNRLFKKHWKENPVHTKQIIIEGLNGKLPITIDIYNNGDIFVDYGRLTQWFPYSSITANKKYNLVNQAYAGVYNRITKRIKRPAKKSIINVRKSSKIVMRTRSYTDGSKEIQLININTGQIKSIKNVDPVKSLKLDTPTINDPDSPIEVIKLPNAKNDEIKFYKIKKDIIDSKLQKTDTKAMIYKDESVVGKAKTNKIHTTTSDTTKTEEENYNEDNSDEARNRMPE